MFDPLAALSADRPLAQWCRGVTLRWYRSAKGDIDPLAQERDAAACQAGRRAIIHAFAGPDATGLAAPELGLDQPAQLAAALGVVTDHAEAHVTRGIVVAAVTLGYLAWVRQQCQRRGVDRVYFVSREGASLARAFNALARALGQADPRERRRVRGEYLPASRLATFLPSLEELSVASLARLWNQYPRQTVGQLVRNLSLPATQFEPLAARHGLEMGRVVERLDDLAPFLADPLVRDAFARHRDAARAALGSYLARRGFFRSPEIAIGDVGWKGSIQTNIERAMHAWHASGDAESSPPIVHGMYLALRRDSAHDTSPSTREGYIADEPAQGVRDWASASVFRCGSMFEVALSVAHRCVAAYSMRGSRAHASLLPSSDPLFASLNAHEQRIFNGPSRLTREAFHRAIVAACEQVQRSGTLPDPDTVRPWLIELLGREIVYPTRQSADSFLEHAHVETFGVFQPSRFDFVTPWSQILSGSPIHWPHRLRVALEAHFWPDAIVRRSGVPFGNFAFDLALTRRARET